MGLGVVTAAHNGFHTFGDVLRLHAALAVVFGALLGASGLAVGVLATLLGRGRDRPGESAFAIVTAVTVGVWLARWFEFRAAYPARWSGIDGFGGMLALAIGFLILDAVFVLVATWGLTTLVRLARPMRLGAGRVAAFVAGTAILSAGAFGVRGPESPVAVIDPAQLPRVALPNGNRVLLVGCDGADWNVIDALLQEGELPTIRRLIEEGVRSPLRTIEDVPSPAIWTSIASSRPPDETGISDFYVQNVLGGATPVAEFPRHFGLNGGLLLRDVLGRGLVRVTPVSSGMVRSKRVWSILADSGVSVGVVNWLVTWPVGGAGRGATYLVSDRAWGMALADRDERADSPASTDPGRAGLWAPADLSDDFPTAAADWQTEDAFVSAVTRRLLRARPTQVTLAYFRDVDAAEHLSWDEWEPDRFRGRDAPPGRGPIRDAYLAFDRYLGDLVAAAGPGTTTIVVSDHGHHAWFTWFGRGTPGGHTDAPDGIFLAAGPAIRPGAEIRPSVYDITPTVLRIVGLPSAADMHGDPLEAILEVVAAPPMVATYETGSRGDGSPLPSTEDEEVLERLRALGYVR